MAGAFATLGASEPKPLPSDLQAITITATGTLTPNYALVHLFAEKGYFGTSLRDVAAAVGVRESALYNYFPGKEALFDALITALRDHLTDGRPGGASGGGRRTGPERQ